ncbi:hypothetical protein [Actinomadura roseirufa]|uniref:hypothetical protein n=1 Tax=Actinomadura roseirufa TaxID=2094049 RepID=UPI001041089D|nr:hypothetical protein [Actinomadura roseirufa]
MDAQRWFYFAMAETVLGLAPPLLAGAAVAFQWWTYRISQAKPEVWLDSIFYILIGSITGATAGRGASDAPSGGFVWAYVTIFLAFCSGLLAAWLHSALARMSRPSRVSPQIYRQDISYLTGLPSVTILSSQEYERWQNLADDLKAHGTSVKARAPRHRSFQSCWTAASRMTRSGIVLSVIAGVLLATGSALAADQPWLLLGLPAGVSLPCAVWLTFWWHRHMLIRDGGNMVDASDQIRELLQQFEVERPGTPRTSMRLRLRDWLQRF